MEAGWAGSQSWTTINTPTPGLREEEARERVQDYADQYLPGFDVVHILPSSGIRHIMYEVKVIDPSGELFSVYVNVWGDVIPFESPGIHTQDRPVKSQASN